MVTELEMAKKAGKTIKVKLKTSKIITGFCIGFTQAIDNDPEIASIAVRHENGQLSGYCQDEIASIEVLE